MKTHVIMDDGSKLRVHFKHIRRDLGNDPELVVDTVLHAFEVGQIDSYRYRGKPRDDEPEFQDAMYPQAITICELTRSKDEIIASGFAFCSQRDQFNKNIGRKIALSRALEQLKNKHFTKGVQVVFEGK